MKIGILVTTFLRDELLFNCIESIKKYWMDNYYLVVMDQGNHSEEKDNYFKFLADDNMGEYIKCEYDIGPLVARNIGIKRIKELNIPYVLMSADSIIFNDNYQFENIINFLEAEEDRFLCSFDIKNRIPWECDIEKTDRFLLDIPRRPKIEFNEDSFQPVDLARNFFLAKTGLLSQSLYDEDRKMCDHETSFYRWKCKGYKCFYYKDLCADYELNRPREYDRMRNRLGQSRQVMMQKYNLHGWVTYSSDLRQFWQEYKKQNRT